MPSGRPDPRRAPPLAPRLAWWLLLCLCPLLAWGGTRPPDLVFQPDASDAAFSVRLIWFQSVTGHFRDISGSVHVDPATGMARVRARIRVDSVAVHPAHYRKRLLGSRFFDATRYPTIRFVSDPLSVDDLRHGEHLHGRLTLHGVTRSVTLQLAESHCRGEGLDGCVLQLHGWLDRIHYDMHAYRGLVSRRVRLNLEIRLKAAPSAAVPAPAASTAPAAASSVSG